MADEKDTDLSEAEERHAIAGDALSDDYAPATKEQIDAALQKLKDSDATSVVLGCHVGDPLVVEGKAVKLGSEGAGSGRGFYALAGGKASASKVAVDPEEEDSLVPGSKVQKADESADTARKPRTRK